MINFKNNYTLFTMLLNCGQHLNQCNEWKCLLPPLIKMRRHSSPSSSFLNHFTSSKNNWGTGNVSLLAIGARGGGWLDSLWRGSGWLLHVIVTVRGQQGHKVHLKFDKHTHEERKKAFYNFTSNTTLHIKNLFHELVLS